MKTHPILNRLFCTFWLILSAGAANALTNTHLDDHKLATAGLGFLGATQSADPVHGVAVSQNGNYVYAGVEDPNGSGWVNWYSIADDGVSLNFLGHIQSADSVNGVAVSPTGNYVYAGVKDFNQGNNDGWINWYSINADGVSLSFLGHIPSADPIRGVAVSNDGKYVYAGVEFNGLNLNDGWINWYSVGSDGVSLSFLGHIQSADPIDGVAISKDGNYLYAGAQDSRNGDGWINWYSIGADGSLTFLGHIQSADPINGVTVSKDGNYIFAGVEDDRNSQGWVNWYSVGSDGVSLTYLGHIQSPNIIDGVALSKDGNYLYAGAFKSTGLNFTGWINWYGFTDDVFKGGLNSK